MQRFETIDDVAEWLEPLGFDAFWQEMARTGYLTQADRAHCDDTLERGIADMETVMTVLKGIVRLELTDRYQLRLRPVTQRPEPDLQIVT